MDGQDWTPVVVRKRLTEYDCKVKGYTKIVSKQTNLQSQQKQTSLDKEDIPKPKMLSSESRVELVQRRLVLKLTQIQLDNMCAFPKGTVSGLEANRRPPTAKELSVLNRVLKCGLSLS